MPGTQVFTYANVGKETVRGTPVAPTRQLYVEGTGVLTFDDGLSFHEQENSGVRTRIRRATQTKEDVALKMRTPQGVSYDDLLVPFTQLKGGMTPVGAGADKTWTATPSMTAANNPEAYSIDVGDETQNWRIQYAMISRWKLSAAQGELTQLEMDWFGQRAVKVAKASPALNSSPKIPGSTWTIKQAANIAGLAGASVIANWLIDWELEVMTGLRWRHYMDGNLYGGQHVETDIAAKLSLTVESTAQAVSEFVDKAKAQTMSFLRLRNTGPALGGSNYQATVDLPVLYEEPQPIGAETEGVNLYKVVANLAYDGTTAASIQPVLVSALTAIP